MLSEELQQFLRKEFPYQASGMVFTTEMKLSKDLKMDDPEDLDDFISHFIKTFNVNLGEKFSFEERFYTEGVSIFEVIWSFLTVKKIEREPRKDLSLAELQRAIETGVLE